MIKLKCTMKIVSIFFTLLLIILLYLVMTESGLKTTLAIASKCIPGSFTIQKSKGRLIHTIDLTDLEYIQGDTSLSLHHATLKWNLLSLIVGRLNIRNLSLNQGKISLPSSAEKNTKKTKSALSNFKFPLQFTLKHIEMNDIELQQQKEKPIYIQSIKLQAHTKKKTLIVKEFVAKSTPLDITANGNIQCTLPFQVNVIANLVNHFTEHQDIHTNIQAHGNLDSTLEAKIKILSPFDATFHLHGENLLQYGTIRIDSQWKNMLIPLDHHRTLFSQAGTFSLNGTLKEYQLQLNTQIGGENIPDGNWHITGTGNWNSLHVTKITSTILKGTVTGEALLTWLPHFTWKSTLQGQSIDPAIKWPNWKGEVNFKLNTKGKREGGIDKISFLLKELSGKLQEHSLSGYIDVFYEQGKITLSKSFLHIGEDAIRISGELNEKWNIQWKATLPDLTQLFPKIKGSVKSQGEITGKLATPKLSASLYINDLSLNELGLKHLNWITDADLNPGHPIKTNLSLTDLNFKHHHIKQFNLSSKGPLSKNELNGSINTKESSWSFQLISSYLNKKYHGSLKKLSLTSKRDSNWMLDQAVSINASKNHFSLAPFLWQSTLGKLSGEINWNKRKDLHAKCELNQLPVTLFTPLLPKQTKIDTMLKGKALLKTNKKNQLAGYLSLSTSPLEIHYNHTHPLHLSKFKIQANLDEKSMNADVQIDEKKNKILSANVTLPFLNQKQLLRKNQPITGKIKLDFHHLHLLPLFTPTLKDTKGRIQANLILTGKVSLPKLEGMLTIKDAQGTITPLGITPTDLNLNLSSSTKNHDILIEGSTKIEEKELQIKGRALQTDDFFPSTLTIKGTNIKIINTDEYEIVVSPDLKLQYQKPKLTLSGNIEIPTANLSPTNFTHSTTLPEDVIIIRGETSSYKTSFFKLYYNIILKLKENVQIKFEGLSGKITGHLKIKSALKELTTGSGELNIIEGKYNAYGETLIIRKGHLLFTGCPISNPGLTIEAIKNIKFLTNPSSSINNNASPSLIGNFKNLIVGLNITGTIKTPILKLFSEPTGLSDSDILSYLVFDTPTNQISGAKAQILLKAAQSLGIGSDSHIMDSIQETFGLSEIGLESSNVINPNTSESQKNTSFVIGKYITPKLYLNYSVGLLVPINILHLRYTLSKKWSIQTDTSKLGGGTDLFYTF